MMVISIIGLLSAIGTSEFKNFTYKARQSEAKIGLGALHSAMTAYYAMYNTYTSCLVDTGFSYDTETPRYYRVGFNRGLAAISVKCGSNPNAKLACNSIFSTANQTGVVSSCDVNQDNQVFFKETRWAQPRLSDTHGTVSFTTNAGAQNVEDSDPDNLYDYSADLNKVTTNYDPSQTTDPAGIVLYMGLATVLTAMKTSYQDCTTSPNPNCNNQAQTQCQATCANQAASNPCSADFCTIQNNYITQYNSCKDDYCRNTSPQAKYACCGLIGSNGSCQRFSKQGLSSEKSACRAQVLNEALGKSAGPSFGNKTYQELFWNEINNHIPDPHLFITDTHDYLRYSSLGWNDDDSRQQFTAQASGVISLKINPGTQVGATPELPTSYNYANSKTALQGVGATFTQSQTSDDIWTIDQDKALINLQRGY